MCEKESDDNPVCALRQELCRLQSRQREEILACVNKWLQELGPLAGLSTETHGLAQQGPLVVHDSSVTTSKRSSVHNVMPTEVALMAADHHPKKALPGVLSDCQSLKLNGVLPGMIADSAPSPSPSIRLDEVITLADTAGRLSADPPLNPGKSPSPSPVMDSAITASIIQGKNKKKRKKNATSLLLSHAKKKAAEDMSKLQQITNSTAYEYLSGSIIVLNAIYIGVQTEVVAEQTYDRATRGLPLMPEDSGWLIGSCLFCTVFIIELTLRWFAEGFLDFFKGQDWGWNVFDVLVVAVSFVDLTLQVAAASSPTNLRSQGMDGISVLRVLRVVRIVRVARVIRVMRFFRELRMMIFSILGSMKSLLWVLLVLVLLFYIFGMSFTNATLAHLDEAAAWQHASNKDLVYHFGSLKSSGISLFMAMSGGNDWGMYYDIVGQLGFFYSAMFLLFITFAIFAVTNIVTGVFVETALQSNHSDRDIVVHEELESKRNYTEAMLSVFEEIDDNDTGFISLDEFEAQLNDERVIAYFNALKLDVSDARTLFNLLDYDHSNEISIDEFLSGCFKLQGESRSLDMKIMQYEMKFIREALIGLVELSAPRYLANVQQLAPESIQPSAPYGHQA